MIPAAMAEVFFKAEAACEYDTGRYQIAAYLAFDLLDIRDAAAEQEASRSRSPS